jgi:hypothetical protein
MEELLRKHFTNQGNLFITIFDFETFYKSSFLLFTHKGVVNYIFHDEITFGILLALLALCLDIKVTISYTDDVLSFSMCENYLFNILSNNRLNNILNFNNCIYKDITFYDYENIKALAE